MPRFTKKAATIALSGVVAAGAATGAYAYWTAGGTGTGTGTTGTSVAITAVQTSTITNLRPGAAAQTLSGNFTNTNDEPVYVTSVTVTVSGTDKPGCTAADYTIANGAMTVGAEVPIGTAQGAWTGATIAFNNTASNQDACKLAVVSLAYVIV